MSKIKLLLDVANDLRTLAGSIQAIADAIAGNEPADASQPETAAPEPEPITLEQVRAVLAQKSLSGFTAEVRGLLEKHGAAKLSQIKPDEFLALLTEAEAL